MSKFRRGPDLPPTVTLNIGDDFLEGKICVLVDDIIDTGGSMIAAARALKEKGAARVLLCATHGIFSNDALKRLEEATVEVKEQSKKVIDKIYVTDTVPLKVARGDLVRVVSVAPLIAETLAVISHVSASELVRNSG